MYIFISPASQRNFRCRRAYVTDESSEYAGQLLAYEFADDHPDRETVIEAGPQRIANQALESGQFAQCTVSKIWQLLMNRAPLSSEAHALDALAVDFAHGYSMRALIRQVISHPEYRYLGKTSMEGQ